MAVSTNGEHELQEIKVVTELVSRGPSREQDPSPQVASQPSPQVASQQPPPSSRRLGGPRKVFKELKDKFKKKEDRENAGAPCDSAMKPSFEDWERLNEDVVLMIDASQSEEAWLEELMSLQHIKDGIKTEFKDIKSELKPHWCKQDSQVEKSGATLLVETLLETLRFDGDKNKALAHVVNGKYNHNAIRVMATELMEKGAGASSTEDYVADPDAEPGADGKYALHWATIRKDANLVEKLLKQANVQKRDELQEESPLFLAVREWKPDDQIFNLLFQKAKKMNVLPQMQRKDGRTLLQQAVIYCNLEAVKRLLDQTPKEYHVLPDNDGKTPLHWAVLQGNVEIVKTLLSDPLEERPHPSLNEGDAAGNTPLHYSVMYGKAKVFEFLMTSYQNEGLEVHKPNSDGRTPLHFAFAADYYFHKERAGSESEEICFAEKLWDDKADILKKDEFGRTPLHEAAYWGIGPTLLEKVLKLSSSWQHKPFTDWTDKDGRIPYYDMLTGAPKTFDDQWMKIIDKICEKGEEKEIKQHSQQKKFFEKYKDLLHCKNKEEWLNRLEKLSMATQMNDDDTAEMQESVNGFKQFEGISCELTTQQAYEVVKMVDILLSDVEDKHHALAILFQIVECPYDISSPYMVICMTADLLNRGADPLKAQERGYRQAKEARKKGHCDKKEGLLQKVVAMEDDSVWLLKQMLHKGVFIEERNYKEGKTPLMTCYVNGHTNRFAMEILLDHGADVLLVDGKKETVLHFAATNGQLEDVRLLLIRGASSIFDKINKERYGTLRLADVSANADFMAKTDLLLQYGLDPKELDRSDENGTYLLHLKDIDSLALKFLIKRGADSQVKDSKRQWTALHHAAYQNKAEKVKCLCDKCPDLRDVQDVRGRTALHISAERRNIDLAKVLLDGGIDQGLTNEAGHTALDIFLENFTTRSDSFWTLVWKTTFHSMETLRGIERKENGNGEDSASSPENLSGIKKMYKILDIFSDASSKDSEKFKVRKDRLMTYLNKKQPDFAAAKNEIAKISRLDCICLLNDPSEKSFQLQECLTNTNKNFTEAVLDKFIIGDRVVNCEALDTDNPKEKEKSEPTSSENSSCCKDPQSGCCHIVYLLLASMLRIPYYFFLACKKPLENFKKKSSTENKSFYTLASQEMVASHPAVQTLLDYKWNFAFIHHSKLFFFYMVRMAILTLALLIPARPGHPNPGCYVDNWDWARLAFEIISFCFFLWKIFDEFRELKEGAQGYFKDHLNWLQLPAVLIPLLLVLPLRAATTWCASTGIDYCSIPAPNVSINYVCVYASTQQWVFACLTYFFNAMLIFEYVAVYKFTGVYLYALVEILKNDISKFLVFFILVLYVFVGSFYLALRSGIMIENNGSIRTDQTLNPLDTLYPWHTLFFGIRTLVEGGGLLDNYFMNDEDTGIYSGFAWLPIVVYLTFLFFLIIVLLNVLIAQMSKSYEDTVDKVNTKYYQVLARHLNRYSKYIDFPYRKYHLLNEERMADLKGAYKNLKNQSLESSDSVKLEEIKKNLLNLMDIVEQLNPKPTAATAPATHPPLQHSTSI